MVASSRDFERMEERWSVSLKLQLLFGFGADTYHRWLYKT